MFQRVFCYNFVPLAKDHLGDKNLGKDKKDFCHSPFNVKLAAVDLPNI